MSDDLMMIALIVGAPGALIAVAAVWLAVSTLAKLIRSAATTPAAPKVSA